MNLTHVINKTYGSDQLAKRLLENLEHIGYDIDRLTPADLTSFDEYHLMGRKATLALGGMVGLSLDMCVLDVGCGIGGPARTLASRFGCRVVGIDLSEEFAITAGVLSERVGLGDRALFQCADALHLPFADGAFDAAFLFHVTMNIPNKKALLDELHRVIKPGGRLALWEICRGPHSNVVYPVPWADDKGFSYLIFLHEMSGLLRNSDFKLIHVEDAGQETFQWAQKHMKAQTTKGPKSPKPNIDLIIPNIRQKRLNLLKNLEQGSITLLRALAHNKP